VEIGGTDQLFNLMVGRDLMRDSGLEAQVALTTPILTGLDGKDKMSKSLSNHIGVTMDPFEMYSRTMSIPDTNMKEWYTLLTGLPLDEVERLCTKIHPKAAKDRLAREIVAGFHPGQADDAAAEWDRKFSRREAPEETPELELDPVTFMDLVEVVRQAMRNEGEFSRGEAKRLIEQGSVEIDGRKVVNLREEMKGNDGKLLKVGKKKKYFRLKLKEV